MAKAPTASRPDLSALLEVLGSTASFRGLPATLSDSEYTITASSGLIAPIAALASRNGLQPLVCITATNRQADDLLTGIQSLLPDTVAAVFPAWETLPHERLSPRAETVARRMDVLHRLQHPETHPKKTPIDILIVSVRAFVQPMNPAVLSGSPLIMQVGQELSRDQLIYALTEAGYARTDMVSKRGEFAVRGGVVDLFSPIAQHPQRIELFGDEIEEIRSFSAADQRTIEHDKYVWAPACRELFLDDEIRNRAGQLQKSLPGAADMLSKIAAGIAMEGMESLMPMLLTQPMVTLLDFLPRANILVTAPQQVSRRCEDLLNTSDEFLAASWEQAAGAGGTAPIDLREHLENGSYKEIADLKENVLSAGGRWWEIGPLGGENSEMVISSWDPTTFRGDTQKTIAAVQKYLVAGARVLIAAPTPGFAARIAELLGENDIWPVWLSADDAQTITPTETANLVPAGRVTIGLGELRTGFGLGPTDAPVVVVLTETDLVTSTARSQRHSTAIPKRRRPAVDLMELHPGDYVVHDQHGISRFVRMQERTVAGARREYLELEFAASKKGQQGDTLFVPTDQMDRITRYIGGEDPSLSKMGGSDWKSTRAKARAHVREIAAELIGLYSQREASAGYAFSADTPWQRELEASFAYVETPDQLTTIDEVKADMEASMPMDRLICGDVGYGKTEIAVRAAFKAVQDGKQVAVLAPTTLLVKQHFATFSERYANFPVRVASLSRFSTSAEAEKVRTELAAGTVDVVIGTHSLLADSMEFSDLGLVVIDEEQRFGVEHKEKLKRLRTNVDVLAMSATPIPRTLEMAVTGIRNMSTLATPPEERHPVLTFVGAYEHRQVSAAIRRELLRDGQVFYLHNKVASIDRVAAGLRDLVPDARIAVAHGQMPESALEQVVIDFWEQRIDVLVCTTIVETGLDIPNANTLLVDGAQHMGLSQLHQLRGRVGRGRERAYAYFLYPAGASLTETAYERLSTVATNTEVGSGMAVAMKDLEIRGAGNLLGGQQSGHIAGVGFDLYMRMITEAIEEYRAGGEVAAVPEMKIELPINAHLPHDYVPSERLRLEAYKKLSRVTSTNDVLAVAGELQDRYGPLPEPAQALLRVGRLRALAREVGLTDIAMQGSRLRFAPVDLRESQELRVKRLYRGTIVKPGSGRVLVPAPRTPGIGGTPLADDALLEWVEVFIKQILQFQ